MSQACPACGTANDDWRPFCTACSVRLDGTGAGATTPLGQPGRPPRPGPPSGSLGSGSASGSARSSGPGWGDLGELDDVVVARPANGRARAAIAVGVLAALAGVTFGSIALARSLTHDTHSAVAPPTHWDPRLAPLVSVVERLRGLRFEHPVAADFYSDARFRQVTNDGLDEPATRSEIQRVAAELRALGLADATVDLAKSYRTLSDSTTLATYDPKTKHIAIRGTTLDVAHDVTIVHELTHALQDQHFDLAALDRKAQPTHTEAVRALIEGDARNVEDRYVDSLSKADKAKYDAAQAKLSDDAGASIASVPDAIVLSQQTPYEMGARLIRALRFEGGSAAVDRAFKAPPLAERFVFDPVAFLDHERVIKVPAAPLLKGAKLLDNEGEFGSLDLFILLAERIDAHQALTATDALRGDHATLYTLHNTTCVSIQFAAGDRAGGAVLLSALRQWNAAMPPGHTSVQRQNATTALLRACDAGARSPKVTHHSAQAYTLPVSRVELLNTFLGQGAERHVAWCASTRVVNGYSVAQLNDDTGKAFRTPQFATRLRAWILDCKNAATT